MLHVASKGNFLFSDVWNTLSKTTPRSDERDPSVWDGAIIVSRGQHNVAELLVGSDNKLNFGAAMENLPEVIAARSEVKV